MTKFNATPTTQPRTTNRAGGPAHTQEAKLALATHLLTSFVQDQFYRSEAEGIQELEARMAAVDDKAFVAKAALYARNRYHMRSVTHLAAAYLADTVKGARWTRPFFRRVVERVDDITEILARYIAVYGRRPLPNALKDGLAAAFREFDAYQLAKYRAEGKALKLVDAVNLLHPKPNPAHTANVSAARFAALPEGVRAKARVLREDVGEGTVTLTAQEALMLGLLVSADTWEARLSQAGQAEDAEGAGAAKAEAWRDLLATGKLGYMALLRNLRNILRQADAETVSRAAAQLADPERVAKSKLLPFRFPTAYDALRAECVDHPQYREVVLALAQAMDHAVANCPVLPGKTLIALDVSGSMVGRPVKIGALFAAVLYKRNDADLLLFDTRATLPQLDVLHPVLSLAGEIERLVTGGGTDFDLVFQCAPRAYDRIVILSDMQAWVHYHTPAEALRAYKARTGADPHVFSWDLTGYGTAQFPAPRIYTLAGWSERALEVMGLLETDRQALVHAIEAITL